MKRAGARDPVKFNSKEELVKLLNAGLPKRAELQPWFDPEKLVPGKTLSLDTLLDLDTDRSYASIRSILRYTLIDGTQAIREAARTAELLGWRAEVVLLFTDSLAPKKTALRIFGWFKL